MQRRIIAVACGTLAVAGGAIVTACFDNSGSSTPPTYTVSGVAATGAPLVGATVTLTDSKGATVQSALTGADGSYSIVTKGTAPFVLTAAFNDVDGTPALLSSVLAPTGRRRGGEPGGQPESADLAGDAARPRPGADDRADRARRSRRPT